MLVTVCVDGAAVETIVVVNSSVIDEVTYNVVVDGAWKSQPERSNRTCKRHTSVIVETSEIVDTSETVLYCVMGLVTVTNTVFGGPAKMDCQHWAGKFSV